MLTVRRYQESDHDRVWTLHNESLIQAGAHAGNGLWDDDLHQVGNVYLATGGEFLVGLYGGEIVAMGALQRLSCDCAEIRRMRVSPAQQRKGFGGEILKQLEFRAIELGYGCLCLETTTKQEAALAFYSKNGYLKAGQKQTGQFVVVKFEKKLLPGACSDGGSAV